METPALAMKQLTLKRVLIKWSSRSNVPVSLGKDARRDGESIGKDAGVYRGQVRSPNKVFNLWDGKEA